jgi:hypothetical protein
MKRDRRPIPSTRFEFLRLAEKGETWAPGREFGAFT